MNGNSFTSVMRYVYRSIANYQSSELLSQNRISLVNKGQHHGHILLASIGLCLQIDFYLVSECYQTTSTCNVWLYNSKVLCMGEDVHQTGWFK